jgi:1-acyl-sn-glycerol-3-phosphate acyltransferase
MKTEIKKLRLGDVTLHRRGSFSLWLIHFIFGVGISIFFKKIELFNSENLPKKSGIIFVSNHPNALIDPALLFIALPRKIAFLAKSTLFKMPVIGYLVRTVGALPLYRQQDSGADVSKNQETFSVARELLKKGGAIAIFPKRVRRESRSARFRAAKILHRSICKSFPSGFITRIKRLFEARLCFISALLLRFCPWN